MKKACLLNTLLITSLIILWHKTTIAQIQYKIPNVKTFVVHHAHNEYSGWPANNGLWVWDKGDELEIVLGFTTGFYDSVGGFHNISEERISRLARSKNGGKKWTTFIPENYVIKDASARKLTAPINFKHPDFMLKMCGQGYHAHELKDSPVFYYSYDRGNSWSGPFSFAGLREWSQLKLYEEITMRTDYHVISEDECILFGSATQEAWKDKVFAFRTIDGGVSFEFLSWIIPESDPYRAVMPQTIPINSNDYITVIRRRPHPQDRSRNYCWIDAYKSGDGGMTWEFLSQVTQTGEASFNGNPPALTKLFDGRLLVVYGNRSTGQLLCRISNDQGATWGSEIIIRDKEDFLSLPGSNISDFGYPRVMQRKRDGKIMVFYYYADKKHGPEQHIDCSIFSLDQNLIGTEYGVRIR